MTESEKRMAEYRRACELKAVQGEKRMAEYRKACEMTAVQGENTRAIWAAYETEVAEWERLREKENDALTAWEVTQK